MSQVHDEFLYDGKCYTILERRMPFRFDPREYGLEPTDVTSDVMFGYWCEYTVAEGQLYLENLYINTEGDYYPEINGIAPLTDGQYTMLWHGHHIYRGLHIPIAYTGKILVGDQLERIHWNSFYYTYPWEYHDLLSFTFKNGILSELDDHSQTGEAIRSYILFTPSLQISSFHLDSDKKCLYDAGFRVWWLEEDPSKAEGWKIFVSKEYIRRFMRLCQKTDFDKSKALEIIDHFGVNAISDAPMENFKDTYRSTFLEIASRANNLPMIEFLFENGADPNLVNPEGKAEVVFWDLQYLWEDDWQEDDRLKIAEHFLEHGANPRIVVDEENLLSYLNFALGYIEDYDSRQYHYRERFEKLLMEYDKTPNQLPKK